MSSNHRFALQAVAAVMALGEFPIQPPKQLAGDSNMLTLPGTGSSGKGHLSQLRLALHSSLKHSAAAPEVHKGLLSLLRPGKDQGSKAKNKMLAALNEAQVPLLPYHRPSRHPKAYNPTKPALTEWRLGGARDYEFVWATFTQLGCSCSRSEWPTPAVPLVGPGRVESGPILLWWQLGRVLKGQLDDSSSPHVGITGMHAFWLIF